MNEVNEKRSILLVCPKEAFQNWLNQYQSTSCLFCIFVSNCHFGQVPIVPPLIYIPIRQPMHKPLSLHPRRDKQGSSLSQHCADSLAFSISQDIAESRHGVSRQLQSLQGKLEDLEEQIMPITMKTCMGVNKQQTLKYANRFDHNSTAQFFHRNKMHSEGKENRPQQANAGKIVRRELQSQKERKRDASKQRRQTDNSKHSLITNCSDLIQKEKEMTNLKREVAIMRASLEKSQRSMSQCSKRLSASKSALRALRQQEKKQQHRVQQLRGELLKSQAIRQKQKRVILTQRRELQKCRELLRRMQR